MTQLKHLKILVVDDEDGLRRELVAFLELYYESVIQASNGNEAMKLFTSKDRSGHHRHPHADHERSGTGEMH